MGITVDSSDGCKHSMRSAFSRAWSVYRYGMGYGIPIWLLYRHYTSYRDSNQNLESRWDDESELSFKHFNWRRYAAVGLLIALCISMYSFSFYIAKQPLYQNTDVNLKQFTDIYNYYWELNGGEDSWGLNDDGTFKKKEYDSNVIYANGDPSLHDFIYKMENDHVIGISYTEEWNDLFIVDVKPSRGYVAAAALLSTQEGEDVHSIETLYETLDTLVDAALRDNKNEFSYQVSEIVITWNIEYENASYSPSLGLVHSDTDYEESEPGHAKIEMTVRITSE